MEKARYKRGKMRQLPGDIPISAKIDLLEGRGPLAHLAKSYRRDLRKRFEHQSNQRIQRMIEEELKSR